ncbi:MAG: diacylglycerol kinase [Acidimicrobiales bacterium]|nr:MAG: diacylglycerol kinase [Acidimicrobiales bacterium]
MVNPIATATSPRGRDILIDALKPHVDLNVIHTRGRGHAIELADKARCDGVELVVCLSGDGMVNEVVNGLLSASSPAETAAARAQLPMLAVVPGGSTNVFARALGIPRDLVKATGSLLAALRAQRHRTINLGKLGDRWFTFCAGAGLDAEVVRQVEAKRQGGHISTATLYARVAASAYSRRLRDDPPVLTLTESSGATHHLAMAVVQNTAPWTYLGRRAIHGCTSASLDRGLDVLGIRELGPAAMLQVTAQLLVRGAATGTNIFTRHDNDSFTITADRPVAVHIDGDFLAEHDRLLLESVPNALTVLAPEQWPKNLRGRIFR